MQSESNHIDNFFRRKEAVSVADKSNVDAHWKQMNELMKTPVSVPISGSKLIGANKLMLYAAAIVLLVVSGLFLILSDRKINISENEKNTTTNGNDQKPQTLVTVKNDSLPNVHISARRISITLGREKSIQQKKIDNKKEKITTETVTTKLTMPQESKADNGKVFNTFFKDLEKEAQEFVISISKDTIITSKEGTELLIPANAFLDENGKLVSGTVKIYLAEFYSFSDIVSNKLTTMSNDKPLATGGMFNIIAKADEKQVRVNPQHPLTLTVPTKKYDPFMQLFTARQPSVLVADTVKKELRIDDVFNPAFNERVNWIAAGQLQYSMINTTNKDITILNFRDNPYNVTYGKKVVGRFEIPYDSKLSKEEMKAELEKRYSKWYDVIKVKKAWGPWRKKNRTPTKHDWYETVQVGDSIVVSLSTATKLKMITKEDSLAYEAEFKRQYDLAIKQQIAWSEWIKVKDSYSFTITGLGWINCDRFIDYPNRSLTDFVLNPGSDFKESYLYSVLIFNRTNSIMSGQWINGKIVFQRIPLYENVTVVSIGAKDGKTWACVQPAFVQKEEVNKMNFEESSPEQLKQKLSVLGNVNR